MITEPVHPWSLVKPVLATLALEHGLTTPTSEYDTGEKMLSHSGEVIRDYKALGILTTADVIAKSSNIGALQLGRLLGPSRIAKGLSKFHLDGLDAPDTTDAVDIAIGRGQVAPLDLLRFYEAIGNNGELIIAPAKTCGSAPTVVPIMSAETSEAMLNILRRVVTHGTGRRAASHYGTVGGKTGTGPHTASFIAMMPQTAVWVLLENIPTPHASEDAAPVARAILEAVHTRQLLPRC